MVKGPSSIGGGGSGSGGGGVYSGSGPRGACSRRTAVHAQVEHEDTFIREGRVEFRKCDFMEDRGCVVDTADECLKIKWVRRIRKSVKCFGESSTSRSIVG